MTIKKIATPTIRESASTNTTNPMSTAFLESASYWFGVAAVSFTAAAALAGSFSWYFSQKLSSKKDLEFRQFKQKSETEIARANERAAEANRIAEEEKLARVKIEERLAGWQLTPEAKVKLVDALKPYAGTPFDLFVDPKEYKFMQTLDAVLIEAGWNRIEAKSPVQLDKKATVRIGYGLIMAIAAESANKFQEALSVLVSALRSQGIPADGRIVTQGESPDAIHILIGQRE